MKPNRTQYVRLSNSLITTVVMTLFYIPDTGTVKCQWRHLGHGRRSICGDPHRRPRCHRQASWCNTEGAGWRRSRSEAGPVCRNTPGHADSHGNPRNVRRTLVAVLHVTLTWCCADQTEHAGNSPDSADRRVDGRHCELRHQRFRIHHRQSGLPSGVQQNPPHQTE